MKNTKELTLLETPILFTNKTLKKYLEIVVKFWDCAARPISLKNRKLKKIKR